MACSCQSSDFSTWSGITRIHPVQPDRMLPDGIHVGIQLNSYRKEGNGHLYALTFGTIEILKQQFVSRVIYSGYASDNQYFSTSVRKLTLTQKHLPIGIRDLEVIVVPEKGIELLEEDHRGRLIPRIADAELLQVSASLDVFGGSYGAMAKYPFIPKDCFWIERKCIHDECGPSYLHNPCRYRCIARVWGNSGPPGHWHETGETCVILPCTR